MHYLTKWLNKMVRLLPVLIILQPGFAMGQQMNRLTLDEANQLARDNYPALQQKGLIGQTASLSIENLDKGYLPQFTVSGQATYQSNVTQVSVPIPGIKIEPLSKDQYKLLADVSQRVFDGGTIKNQDKVQQLSAEADQQKIEVQLYALKQQVNQLFLGVLYLDAEKQQVALAEDNINVGIKNVESQVLNGTSFRSNLDLLKAELLKTQQNMIELDATKKGMVQTLELFINKSLPDDVVFVTPDTTQVNFENNISRPEIKLYTDQSNLFEQQKKLIQSKNLPRASLFFEGGYGRPGLDMLKNEFDFFYIGGIRLNWSLSGLYTRKRENQLVDINKRTVDIQKETFLLNTKAQLKQQQSDIEKLKQLVASDNDIIALRAQVTNAAKAQLQNGVISANDFLKEVNDENQARQSLITHKIQLLQAQINYQTILGKQ